MTVKSKGKVGRPLGYRPPPRKTITHQSSDWSWNGDLLMSKCQPLPSGCWQWLGAKNSWSNLFGAYKNDRAQMTQANRLIYTTHYDEDVTENAVVMTCLNRWCCNPEHMSLTYNKLRQCANGEPSRNRQDV